MLKMLKNSLFSHENKKENTDVANKSTGGVLAVWGSPSSGKTTLSVKLAKHLADRKQDTVLLLCDMTAPAIPYICAPSELECGGSLGSVLSAETVTPSLVKQNMAVLKHNDHIAILGMQKGENGYTYPAYNEKQAAELLELLKEIAPNVIIDCSSYFANDILSTLALINADSVLRLMTCELKSVSYYSSQLALLKNSGRWNEEKQYICASNIKYQEETAQIEQSAGSSAFKLWHSDELETQIRTGELLRDLTLKESRAYKSEIAKISKEVFGT